MTPRRRVGALLAGLGTIAILLLTLGPSPEQTPYSSLTPLLCLVCGPHGGADVLLNTLLFAPMATGLRLLGWPWRRVVATAALLSLSIELLQYYVVPGRDASLSDLLTNTAGAAIAAGFAPHLERIVLPDRVRARHLVLGGIALWLGLLTISAFAMMPWVPSGTLRNDCTRSEGKPEIFTGTVRSVRLNGIPLPCDSEIPAQAQVRAALERGAADLDVVAASGYPRGRRVFLAVRVARGYLMVLSHQGRSANLSTPTAANHLGFHSPIVSLPHAFPPAPGIPGRLEGGMRDRRLWIASEYLGERRMAQVALSPSHGWSAIAGWGIRPDARFRAATALWIGLLILPAAYWASFVRAPAWALGRIVPTLAAGLGGLPMLTGYPPVHWSEWMGGCFGVMLGWALCRFAAYLQSRCGSPSTSAYSSL
jgi:VanZ like family